MSKVCPEYNCLDKVAWYRQSLDKLWICPGQRLDKYWIFPKCMGKAWIYIGHGHTLDKPWTNLGQTVDSASTTCPTHHSTGAPRIRFSSAYLDFIVLRTHEIDKKLLGPDLCHPMQKQYQNLRHMIFLVSKNLGRDF